MSTFIENILLSKEFNDLKKESFLIALSGGVDSIVLLNIFKEIKNHVNINFKAIHINHGISKNSKKWELFCTNVCKKLNIEIIIDRHKIIKNPSESLENNARIARYQSFYKESAQVIVLAHHLEDQVETILSQIARGTDLHNIASMKLINNKQNKIFYRPLLFTDKKTIVNYAKENNLEFIIDESNFDNKFLRNFIRNKILPLFKEFDININNKIINFNNNLQQLLTIADDMAQIDFENCKISHTNLNAKKILNLSIERQINLINFFIHKNNFTLPSYKKILEFVRQINECKIDKKPKLKISDLVYLTKNNKSIDLLENL